MEDLIYRFLSFSKFIDLVINENIVLVRPSLWDDPYEQKYFMSYLKQKMSKDKSVIENINNYGIDYGSIAEYIISNKTFISCWTHLPESDAFWRIYSDNNQSVRIAVKKETLLDLNDCELCDVEYRDFYNEDNLLDKPFYSLMSMKRKAFSHENEVRLISHYKFENDDDNKDITDHIKAFLLVYGNNYQQLENIEEQQWDAKIVEAIELLNANEKQKIKKLSIKPVENFIFSVMLNPNAPSWLDDTLRSFCKRMKINYLGKSKLYTVE